MAVKRLDLESLRKGDGYAGMDEQKVKEAIDDYNSKVRKVRHRANKRVSSYKKKAKLGKWAIDQYQPDDDFAVDSLTEFISHWHTYQRLIPKWTKIYEDYVEARKFLSFLERNQIEKIVLKARNDVFKPEIIHVPKSLVALTVEFLKTNQPIVEQNRHILKIKKTATPPLQNVAFWHDLGPRLVNNLRLAGFSKKFLAFVVGKNQAALTKALDKKRWHAKDRKLVDMWFQSSLDLTHIL